MLYISLCLLICFILFIIYEPEININIHKYDQSDIQRLEYEKEYHKERAAMQQKELEDLDEQSKKIKETYNSLKDIMEGDD